VTSVQTVGGPVESSALGVTLMHEHVFVLSADVQQNYPQEWGSEQARCEQAVAKLQEAYETGIRTIVDLTVVGLGRYLPRIQAVASRVPVNIVVATGIYTYRDAPFYFRHREAGRTDPMVEMFVGDIVDGIAGTGVKAGMLKCAIDEPGLTPDVERVMRAVAKAHLLTGTPITVHTHPASRSAQHVHRVMCLEEGVAPDRVVLAHSGDSTDVDHLVELADLGFVLGMDRFGLGAHEERTQIVVELLRRGYASQLVLSHDTACYLDWLDPAVLAQAPNWRYTHLLEDVVPDLLGRGVRQDQVEAMLVEVPRAVLGTSEP